MSHTRRAAQGQLAYQAENPVPTGWRALQGTLLTAPDQLSSTATNGRLRWRSA
jgi:hypothetical protein